MHIHWGIPLVVTICVFITLLLPPPKRPDGGLGDFTLVLARFTLALAAAFFIWVLYALLY